jgi:hypothetical protein
MIWRKEAICEMEVGLSPVISILGDFLVGRDDRKI